MSATAILNHAGKLPTVPRVVHQLIASFNRDDTETREVSGLIESDPVISAKVLRLANSAYFHRQRGVSSIRDAVLHLGFERVRTLVVGCGLAGAVQAPPGMDKPAFWRHSMHTAVVAQALSHLIDDADTNTADPIAGDLAFAAGLIYPIGELLLRWAYPVELFQLDISEPCCTPARARSEAELLGTHFADVSAALAEHWRFPDAFCTALAAAGDPENAEPFSPLGALVGTAATIAVPAAIQGTAIPLDGDSLARIGIRIDQIWSMPPVDELAAGMEGLFDEV